MPTFYYVTLGTFHVMCVWITSSCWEPVASCGCNDRLNPRRRASHRLWDGRVLNKGEEQTDVRKQPIIISHFMKVRLPNRIQQIERGTNKLWPSVLPILSFTMCSVCSEQQCIMLNFMNTLQLGDPWLAHSTEEIQRAGNSSAGAGCKSQAYCVIMEEGEREKEQHDQWATQNGGSNLL